MKKFVSKVCSILYHLTGHLLPDSYYYLHIGSKDIHIDIGLKYRRFLARRMIKECGVQVNIERRAGLIKIYI